MRISIQGYRGSFHHIVAEKNFGNKIKLLERKTFKNVFEDVIKNKADCGIVAIENSLAGSLHENFDLLLKYKVFIVGESYLRIAQQLISLPGTKISDIKEVHSHIMALKQCAEFLEKHPTWKIIEEPDTALAVADIFRKKKKDWAAIASELAADLYGMKIIAKNIETNKQNYTRFFILSHKPTYEPRANKTSIVFSTKNAPGALARILDVFADLNINLTKVESRPIVGKVW